MRGRSIRWRLLLSYILLAMLILTMLSMTFFHLYSEMLYEKQHELMHRDAAFLANIDVAGQTDDLQEKLRHVYYTYVAQSYEGVIWLLDMDGVGAALDSADGTVSRISIPKQQMRQIMKRIRDDEEPDLQQYFTDEISSEAVYVRDDVGRRCGVLLLHMRHSSMDERLDDVHRSALYATLVALICSFGLMLAYGKWIINPLNKISAAFRHVRYGDFSVRVEMDRNDEIGQMAHSFNDMLMRLDNEIQARNRFVANISHELRTPLASVQGYLQGMSDGVIGEDYLDVVQNEVRRMSKLVQDLLQMSYYTSDAFTLQCCEMDLCDLISRVVLNMESRLRKKDLHVQIDFEHDEQMIFADPMRLEQVFINLLDNAVKFTPEGGHVSIKMEMTAQGLCVYVADDGIGMSDEACRFAFYRFYKADVARTPGSGYGLGLSIVHQIMRLHKTSIRVESQAGKGTTFTLLFPNEIVL